ncbi:uncharacterized protein LOC135370540 [Ornithodoros turicata]|uniref:uncharacterized protein LOC135370540 n=1 Tax=Ornithodoros turicata TaxID=34597 RepID=UPI003139E02A
MEHAAPSAGGDPAASSSLSHFSVRLPPFFNQQQPQLWFAQVEAQFTLAGITAENRKFFHVISVLPPDIAMEVSDLLLQPSAQQPYSALKEAIISRTMASERKRLQLLLASEELGGRRPSQMLRHMESLLGSRAATFDRALLKELFLQRLPSQVQMVLATASDLDLAALAVLADSVMEVTGSSVSAISHSVPPQHQEHLPRQSLSPAAASLPSPPSSLAVDSHNQHSALTEEIRRLALLVGSTLSRQRQPSPRSPHRSRRRASSPRLSRRTRSRSSDPNSTSSTPPCWYRANFGASARHCVRPCGWPGNDGEDH